MPTKKHYSTLGISENATMDDIKKAYRKMAVTHHPDKGGNENKFKEINEAYDILGDPKKKEMYDMGIDANNPSNKSGGFPFHHAPFDNDFGFFNVFFNGNTSSMFPNSTNNSSRNPQRKVHHHEMKITMKEAYFGCKKTIHLTCNLPCECLTECSVCKGDGVINETVRKCFGNSQIIQTMQKKCDKCKGKGNIKISTNCDICKNKEYVEQIAKIMLDIPSGIPNDFTTKVKHPVDVNSDLLIKVNVEMLPGYTRQNDTLFYKLKIPLIDALLGSQWKISHPSERDVIVNTEGTLDIITSGKTLNIQGKGMTEKSKLIVEFEVLFPPSRRVLDKNLQESTFKNIKENFKTAFND